MKKNFLFILVLVLSFSLVGCGCQKEETTDDETKIPGRINVVEPPQE